MEEGEEAEERGITVGQTKEEIGRVIAKRCNEKASQKKN